MALYIYLQCLGRESIGIIFQAWYTVNICNLISLIKYMYIVRQKQCYIDLIDAQNIFRI